AYLNDLVHVQQAYLINREDVTEIKEAIVNYGAVSAAMYYQSSYLDNVTAGYYDPFDHASNHAIAIVGWDDNFSRDSFKTQPATDGAWLVKNSWGTTFGDQGYIWLSYEDATLKDGFCVLVGEAADNYDNNYQYDGSFMNKYLQVQNTISIANVFRTQSTDVKEALRAVAFEVGNTNIDYSIQIYKDLKDETNPASGKACLQNPVCGSTKFQGYYTVELPEEILLEPSSAFAVVIDLKKDGDVRIVLENTTVWNNTNYVAGCLENQSFFKINRNWQDAGTNYGGNLRIKAFTDNTELTGDIAVSGVETVGNLSLQVGEEYRINANVLPESASDKRVNWKTEDDGIATVDENGVVTGVGRGTTVITCTTEDGAYHSDTTVTVRNVLALATETPELAIGDKGQMLLSVNGAGFAQDASGEYEWTVTPSGVVDMAEDGSFTGTGMGTVQVVCSRKDDVAEKAESTLAIRIPFLDVSVKNWQYPYIVFVYEQGIMQGKKSTLFDLNAKLKRTEFVTLLYNEAGKPQ
ncbi:MAG: Ig-like domain-containing protein, partial [Lachnospiraceae bacterium]|nr:Ig-like domain-containing protein [Lachnospiraceae bacterium]